MPLPCVPSRCGHPKSAGGPAALLPVLRKLTSSTRTSPTSPIHRSPVARSKLTRDALRMPVTYTYPSPAMGAEGWAAL